MARERGLEVDEAGFAVAMQQQKARAKAAGKFQHGNQKIDWQIVSDGPDSKFIGYDNTTANARLKRWAQQDDNILVVLDQTPFYAESGGQVGDIGKISGTGIDLEVADTWKDGEHFVHQCSGKFATDAVNQTVTATVDDQLRNAIRRNHTATHLMHAALKQVLGDHVHQAGSLVNREHLRFDLTHFEKVTPEQIVEIETIVNREIRKNTALQVDLKSYDEAREAGAEALFGEKYGDQVRVITIADYSMELCGGTHVGRTGDIGFFKIIEESALAAGVRRIVALTGAGAVDYVQNLAANAAQIQSRFNCPLAELPDRVDQLLDQKKQLEKELKHQQQTEHKSGGRDLMKAAVSIGSYTMIVAKVSATDNDDLKARGDGLLEALSSGIGVLGAEMGRKPGAVVVITPDLIKAGLKAGEFAKAIGQAMGAGGGGRPHLATAGGKDIQKLPAALDLARELIKTKLEKLTV